jgi:hypothetical protein
MKNRVILCLVVLFATVWAFNPAWSTNVESSSGTDKCYVPPEDDGKVCLAAGWCVPTENFAFSVKPKEDLSVMYVQHLASTPGSPDMRYIIEYLMKHQTSRMFSCFIRPLRTMHSVDFRWNVGLQLKSGEVVWATDWIYSTNGFYESHEPFGLQFSPGMQGMTESKCSFTVFCVFPNQTESGKEWRNGQVSGLVIE